MAKILLVEDDSDLSESLKDWLAKEHYATDIVGDGVQALEFLRDFQYDVIILDIQLPGLSGIEVLRRFRASKGATPVIMLTSRSEVIDKLEGLDSGADDYLTKPFEPKELSARVRAQLRRREAPYQDVVTAGDLTLQIAGFHLLKGEQKIHLQPKEFALLEFLMRHANEVFSLETMLQRIWPSESETSPEGLRVHITNIRAKIDSEGKASYIETVHRVGYKFVPQ